MRELPVDIRACNEKIAILGLKFPVTSKEEKKALVKLTREYHPDSCEASECKAIHEFKIAEIMEAHKFYTENHERCSKILSDYVNAAHRKVDPTFDFNAVDQKIQGDVVEFTAFLNELLG